MRNWFCNLSNKLFQKCDNLNEVAWLHTLPETQLFGEDNLEKMVGLLF